MEQRRTCPGWHGPWQPLRGAPCQSFEQPGLEETKQTTFPSAGFCGPSCKANEASRDDVQTLAPLVSVRLVVVARTWWKRCVFSAETPMRAHLHADREHEKKRGKKDSGDIRVSTETPV